LFSHFLESSFFQSFFLLSLLVSRGRRFFFFFPKSRLIIDDWTTSRPLQQHAVFDPGQHTTSQHEQTIHEISFVGWLMREGNENVEKKTARFSSWTSRSCGGT
jgi:hypothetical protein